MLYVFSFLTICSFIRQRDKIMKQKRNLVLFLLLSLIGIAMGILHSLYPYMPSLAASLEKYLK